MMFSKALNKNIPYFTLVGVCLSLFLGIFLAISCYILYKDFFSPRSADTGLTSESYIILNKQVSMLNMLGAGDPVFSSKELAELKEQSFISEVAPFTAAKFRIKAYAPLHENRSFYTDLFLESVPTEFLDVTEDFNWTEGETRLPVIVPRTYLNLYNFGFAPSQGLPQINESSASALNIKMELEGEKSKQIFWAKIHSFTDRVNSILVPNAFMEWANQNIGNQEETASSRVILKCKSTSDPALQKFMKDHNYSTNREMLEASKAASAFKVIIGFEFFQGALILLLSLALILISSMLLIEKSRSIIYKLRLIGYSSNSVLSHYMKYYGAAVLVSLTLALILIGLFHGKYSGMLADVGFTTNHSLLGIILFGFLVALFSGAMAFLRLRSRLSRIL